MDQGYPEAPDLRFLLLSLCASYNSGRYRTRYADDHLCIYEENAPGSIGDNDTVSAGSNGNRSYRGTLPLRALRKNSSRQIE